MFVLDNFSLSHLKFTEFLLLFAVIWGDWKSKGCELCQSGDECGGDHSSLLLPAEMRILSFPQTDVVSQPPATLSCCSPYTLTCKVLEELGFLSLLLKRNCKESWPIKWKLAHWGPSQWWPSVSGKLADSFSWWRHMMHWINRSGKDRNFSSPELCKITFLHDVAALSSFTVTYEWSQTLYAEASLTLLLIFPSPLCLLNKKNVAWNWVWSS